VIEVTYAIQNLLGYLRRDLLNKPDDAAAQFWVPDALRMRRLMLDMSQTDIADALGLTFQQVQKYEKGTNRISASRLQHISQILGGGSIMHDELFGYCRSLSGWTGCRGPRALPAAGKRRRAFPLDAEADRLGAALRGGGGSEPWRKHQPHTAEELAPASCRLFISSSVGASADQGGARRWGIFAV
jgi:DNA-binding XRE family transcriptional regulator